MKQVEELWHSLWPAIQEGSARAFEQLMQMTYRRYRWYAYHQVGRWDEADDIVQTAWWRLWDHRAEIRREPMQWMYVTVRRLCIDYHRRRFRLVRLKRRLRGESPAAGGVGNWGGTTALAEGLDFWRIWDRVKAELGEQQREVFWMHDILGLGFDQIAEQLGISSSTARSHLSLARKKLRHLYGEALGVTDP